MLYTCRACHIVLTQLVTTCPCCEADCTITALKVDAVVKHKKRAHFDRDRCLLCGQPNPRANARYCSAAHRQRGKQLYAQDPVKYAHLKPLDTNNTLNQRYATRKTLIEAMTTCGLAHEEHPALSRQITLEEALNCLLATDAKLHKVRFIPQRSMLEYLKYRTELGLPIHEVCELVLDCLPGGPRAAGVQQPKDDGLVSQVAALAAQLRDTPHERQPMPITTPTEPVVASSTEERQNACLLCDARFTGPGVICKDCQEDET